MGLYLFTLPPPPVQGRAGVWTCIYVFVHITPSTPVQGRVGVWACICSHCPLNTVQGRVWVWASICSHCPLHTVQGRVWAWACICSHCPLHTGTRKGGGIGLYLFTLPSPHRNKERGGVQACICSHCPLHIGIRGRVGCRPAFVHIAHSTTEICSYFSLHSRKNQGWSVGLHLNTEQSTFYCSHCHLHSGKERLRVECMPTFVYKIQKPLLFTLPPPQEKRVTVGCRPSSEYRTKKTVQFTLPLPLHSGRAGKCPGLLHCPSLQAALMS